MEAQRGGGAEAAWRRGGGSVEAAWRWWCSGGGERMQRGTSVCVCEVDAVCTFDPPRTEGGSADWLESKTPDSPFRLTLWIRVLWGD